jgi:hypothetical protein
LGDTVAEFNLPQTVEVAPDPGQSAEASQAEAPDARVSDQGHAVADINLRKLAEALDRRAIDEIATLMRALTYGDMIELAEGIWNARSESPDLSRDTLAPALHRWSTSRATQHR